jgi:hypothetical protein
MASSTTTTASNLVEVASLVASNPGAVSPNSLLNAVTSNATTNGTQEINTSEYLAQLIKDKNQLAAFPNVFIHLERLLDEGMLQLRLL